MTGKPERQTAEILMHLKNNRWEAKMCSPYPTDTTDTSEMCLHIHLPILYQRMQISSDL